MDRLGGHALYAAAWLSFGLGHSLLAAAEVKRPLLRRFGAGYRLAFNLFAAGHLALVFWIGGGVLGGASAFVRPDWLILGQDGLAVAGLAIMVAALTGYDLGRFSGLAQLRAARAGAVIAEDEPLRRDGLHRWVRHPIYAGAHLFLWGRAVDQLSLATALWGSLYLLVGMASEERALIRRYGEAYRDYRRLVPALVPWRRRAPKSRH
ncbi:MAG: isoprenylcysteine carboxylmethyltransferase family protein [Azospirillum sp.]|nr:isoprenylcysteine carboxylmethyltransferase family protein [Azospirillum sp.]